MHTSHSGKCPRKPGKSYQTFPAPSSLMSSISSCTQRLVDLACAFFTGVDISVRNKTPNSGTTEQAALKLAGTVVSLLGIQSSDENLKTNVMRSRRYRYHPRLTAAIDDRGHIFFSAPGYGNCRSNGHHAESQLLRFLEKNGQLKTVKFICVSNSPCSSCARELINLFKDRPDKPTIYFLWVHGKGLPLENDEKYMEAIMSLKDLDHAGFKLGLWDRINFSNFLKDNASEPSDHLLVATFDLLFRRFAKQIYERAEITKIAIQTVKNYNNCVKVTHANV